jgi:hypothetical protein
MHLLKFSVMFIVWGFLMFTAGFCEAISGQNENSLNKTVSPSAALHEMTFLGPRPNVTDIHIDPETGESNVTSWGMVMCATSMASPTNQEIEGAIQKLMVKANGLCVQTNGIGTLCTKLATYLGADVSLCGSWFYYVKCKEMAWAVGMIRDLCKQSDGRAGGAWYFDKYLKTVLH